jgi:uncharacterized protein (DUF2235 family)
VPKRLVLCFDGTWNTPDNRRPEGEQVETNVVRMFDSIRGSDSRGTRQVKWYDEGVGTRWYERIRGGAFGIGLDRNIRQGYAWLAERYADGDEVFLFGFSRGAYTARSLVGLIRKCGLLRSERLDRVDVAYRIYRMRHEGPDANIARMFRGEYSRRIGVRFLGVWDTVGSLGIPIEGFDWFNRRRYEFHDTRLSAIVENAYHAVAVDEHREPYDVTLWNPKEASARKLEQRWFVGSHGDVGGGYVERELSDLTLRWMQERAREAGLALHEKGIPATHPHPETAVLHDAFPTFLRGVYARLHRRHYRVVGSTPFGNEVVDPTVARRLAANPAYRPRNAGLRERLHSAA